MNEGIIVRPGTLGDHEVVAEFNRLLAWETEALRLDPETLRAGVSAILADPRKGHYFVAEREGRVVGQACVTFEWSDWRNGMIWWLQSVYVEAPCRRAGVFALLLDRIAAEARAAGVVALRLYVEKDNETAQAVYTRRGWTMTHYRVMERALGSGAGAGKTGHAGESGGQN